MTNRPIIAITMGDPCGIGPEIIVKALQSPEVAQICVPLVIGDRLALERALCRLRLPAEDPRNDRR